MSHHWCKRGCGNLLIGEKTCRCSVFIVIDEDGDEYQIAALTEEAAAEKYAEDVDAPNDNFILDSTDGVLVTINGNGYRVFAEPSVVYTVREEVLE